MSLGDPTPVLEPPTLQPGTSSGPALLRIISFCPWAGPVRDAQEFVASLPATDLSAKVSNPRDRALLRMARLDCDWHGENVRAFAAVRTEGAPPLPSWTFGVTGAAELLARAKPPEENWWLVIAGQHPQLFGATAGRFFQACARRGIRVLYYAFDEASRTMPCFGEIAPFLDVLVHDEFPLGEPGRSRLRPDCRTIHRSWVANVIPFAAPFVAEADPKILFLGSRLGLTPHRQRQIDFLRRKFKDRFVAICDHSLAVADRLSLGRFQVSLCPEGRKFATPAMSATHTDRPFWSGCLGLVPVSEDSKEGGRLQSLHEAHLLLRYPHGDLNALAARCEEALAAPAAWRRRIYDHYNRNETVTAAIATLLS